MKGFARLVKVNRMASSKNPLQILVAKHDQWETKQPKIGEGIVPPTPCRVLITGPSGSGKLSSSWICSHEFTRAHPCGRAYSFLVHPYI